MSIFKDMMAMFKKKQLRFLESYPESDQVYTFVFEKEHNLNWNAGQYGLITITHKKIKRPTKPFSIASAPAENVVKITTSIGEQPSEFKQALLELKTGMTVGLQGPVGSFSLQDGRPALLIAGGIGITPFRSMLKQAEAEGSGNGGRIRLLYLDSKGTYLYQDELNAASVPVSYITSRDDVQREIDEFAVRHPDGQYFIAGPKAMVDSIAAGLQERKVPKGNIKKDVFYGY